MTVRTLSRDDMNEWMDMRISLWPDCSEEEHLEEIKTILSGDTFEDELLWYVIGVEIEGELIGFSEVSLKETLNKCPSSPVAYLEGWYVSDNFRKQGVGKEMVTHIEKWAVSQKCSHLGSDIEKDNVISLTAHKALGFHIIDETDDEFVVLKKLV